MATVIRGVGGALVGRGRRLITELGKWEATKLETGGFIVHVAKHAPDAFEWEHNGGPFRVELELGRAVMVYDAEITNREPLIVETGEMH